jgi:hypothetical protein
MHCHHIDQEIFLSYFIISIFFCTSVSLAIILIYCFVFVSFDYLVYAS